MAQPIALEAAKRILFDFVDSLHANPPRKANLLHLGESANLASDQEVEQLRSLCSKEEDFEGKPVCIAQNQIERKNHLVHKLVDECVIPTVNQDKNGSLNEEEMNEARKLARRLSDQFIKPIFLESLSQYHLMARMMVTEERISEEGCRELLK